MALRLISEREAEIEAFQSQEYWSIEADLTSSGGVKLKASVTEASLMFILPTQHQALLELGPSIVSVTGVQDD